MRVVLLMIMMLVSIGTHAEDVSNGKMYFTYGKSGLSSFDQSPVKFINKVNFKQPKGLVDFRQIFSNEKESPLELTEEGNVRLVVEGRLIEVLGKAEREGYDQVLNLSEGFVISSIKTGSYPHPYSTCRAHFYSNRGVDLITQFKLQISKGDEVLIESEYKTFKNLFNIPSDIPLFCRD